MKTLHQHIAEFEYKDVSSRAWDKLNSMDEQRRKKTYYNMANIHKKQANKNIFKETRHDAGEIFKQLSNPEYVKKTTELDDMSGECVECGADMMFSQNEAMLYCTECGMTEFILIDSDRPSYKDPPRESSYYAYKRINHFNELLAQFQAKGSTDIPQDIFAILPEPL
jgi:ribosomal protein S27AE